jgi:prepilin-type N-terminal cleavage/methylation domain-containing protein
MHPRRGFTLVEVTVALTLGALVVLLAHQLYGGVLDASARLTVERERLDREANAHRLLATLAGSLDIGGSRSGEFRGGANGVSFSAWYVGGRGWPERRDVSLAAKGTSLILEGLGDSSLVLADSVQAFTVDYLLGLGAGERWMRSWSSALSAPLALRLRIARAGHTDTLLLPIGPRG